MTTITKIEIRTAAEVLKELLSVSPVTEPEKWNRLYDEWRALVKESEQNSTNGG